MVSLIDYNQISHTAVTITHNQPQKPNYKQLQWRLQ